jgi:ankyrin repeat protein
MDESAEMPVTAFLALTVLIFSFVMVGPVAATYAATYNGVNVDGQEFDGIAYSTGTNDSYTLKIRFDGNKAFLTTENGKPWGPIITFDSEEFDDPHRITGKDSDGIAWELNVNGLDEQTGGIGNGSVNQPQQPPDELMAAVQMDDPAPITRWLEENYNPRSDNWILQELFIEAVERNRLNVLSGMLQSGVNPNLIKSNGESAIYIATTIGNEAVISMLLKGGANPLTEIGKNSFSYLIDLALESKNNRFLEICLEKGLSPDYRSSDLHDSLINESIKQSNIDALRILLNRGASIGKVTIRNNYKTTLAIALEKQGDDSEYVRLLKEKGAYTIKYTEIVPAWAESATDKLRVRKSPSLTSSVAGYLMKGDRVQLLEVTPLAYNIDGISSPWIRVEQGNLHGWVFGGYLKLSTEPTESNESHPDYTGQSP